MNGNINILDLYKSAFGHVAYPYASKDVTERVPGASPYDMVTIPDNVAEVKSFFGTPIFMPCKMQISKRNDELEYFTLPNEPLIEISGSKKIVETDFDGNDGSFKELFAMKDYNVVIRGICVDENNPEEYPDEQVRKLRAIYELRNSLKIVTPLTTMFGIDRVSIMDLRVVPVEGGIGFQPYEIICKSDKEFELEIKKKNG